MTMQRVFRGARMSALAMVVILGAAFVGLPREIVDALAAVGLLDPLPAMSEDARRYVDFVYGVLGAVMIGWGLALLLALRGVGRVWVFSVSLGAWFVVDTALSVATGHPRNVVLNVVTFLALMLPHLALARTGVGKV